uniref:MARVEL domain-containing protein n=1 Tax=Panagrellus redivivus TaxID=6233 RepID=A0A7E4VKZ8_PANRE
MVKLEGEDGDDGSTAEKGDCNGDGDGEDEGVDIEETTDPAEASRQPLIDGKSATHDEDAEYTHNFMLFCWRRPILKSAKTVCFLSCASFAANLLSLFLAGSQTSLHLAIELLVLITEFLCLLLLMYSLAHRAPKCMWPYLIFGAVWNVFLVLLWLLCLAELFKGAHFSFRVSHALSQVFLPSAIGPQRRRYRPQPIPTPTDSLWTAMSMLIGLGATIAVNFWFLHIIVLAYYYLRSKQNRQASTSSRALGWTAPSPPATPTPVNVEPVKVGNGNVVFL